MRLFPNREYHSGSRWAFWRWKDISENGDLYLRRLHVVQVPYVGAIMVHWIKRADRARDLHDHPVSFFSIPLRGWYLEELPAGRKAVIRWWNYKHATDSHRIVYTDQPLCTLVFAGPKVREWGFWTDAGWVHWRDYPEEN